MSKMSKQANKDKRIQELHQQASDHWPKLEGIIDELKGLGEHSLDGNNAINNVRDWLSQLAKR